MGIGPFESFAFPGVYTQTLNEAPRVTAAGGLRVPAFLGVADEVTQIQNFEMIRGSSAFADNPIIKENITTLNGTNRNFTITYKPIVDGNGNGTVTRDPRKVTVYVDGNPVPVASVNGTIGEIYLVNIPPTGAVVQASYYFKHTDTLYTNEDLSDQAGNSNKAFKVHNVPIVQGDNGGITTTDPSKVTVTVNSSSATVTAVDGDSGIVTLASAPLAGQTVLVTYYSNEFQDTADILPTPSFNSMIKVGLSPGTSDFVEGTDYVVDSSGTFATIQWGHSKKITSGSHTIGTTYFDDTQITTATLFDNANYRRKTVDGTSDGVNRVFTLEATPVDGQGLGWDTDDPSKLPALPPGKRAFYGSSPTGATDATVIDVDASLRTVTLSSAPTAGSNVYVDEYVNILPDDTWTLTNTLAGGAGVGQYTVSGENSGIAMNVAWMTTDWTVASPAFGTEHVAYPTGIGPTSSDAQVIPGYAVAETVRLTFLDATSYQAKGSSIVGTGSSGDNTGYLNQTYIDKKTGFRVTVIQGSAVYQAGDYFSYDVSPVFTASGNPTRAIPGIRVVVANTTGIGVGDTAVLKTYNKSGNEPDVGDFYYVSFNENKSTIETALFYTLERDALNYTGPLGPTNLLGMAAHLAFLNGTAAVVLYQVPKMPGLEQASDADYIAGIDYFNDPMQGGLRPTLMQPVTTSTSVLNYLRQSNIIQSGLRYGNEHMTYFGFALNTSPTTAQTYARAMNCERMIGIYPDGAVTTITDELGFEVEYLFDGALLAAAIAGRDTSPAFDVAEPLTRKPVVGFTRLFRRMDSVTAAQTANSGLTVLEEQAAGIVVKIDLTTDVTSVLTRTPSVVRIKDFVQRGTRSVLDPYIGQKFLGEKTSEIETTLGSYLGALKRAKIIQDFNNVKATVDPNDATTVQVVAYYAPVLPLLYIVVTYNLRSKV